MTTAELGLLIAFEAVLIAFCHISASFGGTKHQSSMAALCVWCAVPFLHFCAALFIPLVVAGYATGDDDRVRVGGTVFGFAAMFVIATSVIGTFMLWRRGDPRVWFRLICGESPAARFIEPITTAGSASRIGGRLT